jgi:CobQ-like glutamine amidotransferase family enzyme
MKIEVLFPEVGNLFGDMANVRYLKLCVPEAEVVTTSLKDVPAFMTEPVDLVYMGAMTERAQEMVIEKLRPYMEKIRELIAAGIVFLITGNALEVFGSRIENEDGTSIQCLGLYNTVAKRRMLDRHNSIFLGKFEGMDVVGFKCQFAHSYGTVENGLFTVTRGVGFCPGSRTEGVRINNFFATYLQGALLAINPPFMRWFLRLLGVKEPHLMYEEAAQAAFDQRVKEFSNPRVAVIE